MENDWEKLRSEAPGLYESDIQPAPDPNSWMHVKIVIDSKNVAVFVNHSARPCMQVKRLSNTKGGAIGFWVGNNSGGAFSDLIIMGD